MTAIDRIDRTITIAATPEQVFDLIKTPGWYINDGAIREHTIERRGDFDIVTDPVHGEFPIRTEVLDHPQYARFAWVSDPARQGDPATETTTVEFWIDPRIDGSVDLRVVESGFEELPLSPAERHQRRADNDEGWRIELEAARTYLEA